MAGWLASVSTDVGRVDLPTTALEESAGDALDALPTEEDMSKCEWLRETEVMSRSVSYGKNDVKDANVVDSALQYDYQTGFNECECHDGLSGRNAG